MKDFAIPYVLKNLNYIRDSKLQKKVTDMGVINNNHSPKKI